MKATKTKVLSAENLYRSYTYYRCTHRKLEVECIEKPITLDSLEKQIEEEINKFTIHPNFKNWALKVARRIHDKETEDQKKQYDGLNKKYNILQTQLNSLTKMRLNNLLSDEEYMAEKLELRDSIDKTRDKLDRNQDRRQEWIDIMEKAFDFAVNAREAFVEGNLGTKRNILLALGQNYTLKDKKLSIKPVDWLVPLYEQKESINGYFSTLELNKTQSNTNKNTSFEEEMSLWGPLWDVFRTLDWSKLQYNIPEL